MYTISLLKLNKTPHFINIQQETSKKHNARIMEILMSCFYRNEPNYIFIYKNTMQLPMNIRMTWNYD